MAALYPTWDLCYVGDFCKATHEGAFVWRHEDIFLHHDAQRLAGGNLLFAVAAALPADKTARVCGGGGNLRKDGADRVIQSDIVREANRKGETV